MNAIILPNTVFLAQFLGAFAIVMGISMLLQRRRVTNTLIEIFSSKTITYIIGLLEVVGGILLVLSHNTWDSVLVATVTALGWLLLIEGVFYLFAPQPTLKSLSSWLRNKQVYYIMTLAYIAIGAYLMFEAFGAPIVEAFPL
jgi:uncharacterized membrane protein HdeD (DUF308 family)